MVVANEMTSSEDEKQNFLVMSPADALRLFRVLGLLEAAAPVTSAATATIPPEAGR